MAERESISHVAFYVNGTSTLKNGEGVSVKLKTIRCSDRSVRWVVRDVLECFYLNGVKWGTSRVTNTQMTAVESRLMFHGLRF